MKVHDLKMDMYITVGLVIYAVDPYVVGGSERFSLQSIVELACFFTFLFTASILQKSWQLSSIQFLPFHSLGFQTLPQYLSEVRSWSRTSRIRGKTSSEDYSCLHDQMLLVLHSLIR